MARKKKGESESQRLSHLAHDVLILHLFELFERIEGKKFTAGKLQRLMTDVKDIRVIQAAMEGHGIHESSAEAIAEGLSRKMEKMIEGMGGPEKFAAELRRSMEWADLARSFQWLEDRITGKPPYLRKGDLILNRDDRHLLDDYRSFTAIVPCPNGMVEIHRPEGDVVSSEYQTLALIRTSVVFSPHNRNFQRDFALRHATNGKLKLLVPDVDDLKDPASYRRNRDTLLYMPDPRSDAPQHMMELVYGGYDSEQECGEHVTFTQNALYRNVTYTLDLSLYPQGSIVAPPRLLHNSKLAGREFDCCKLAAAGEGQTIKPSEESGQRRVWKFQSVENMMIGVHWRIDPGKIPPDYRVTEEHLLSLLPPAAPPPEASPGDEE